jgi:hypothetical protein
MKNTGSSFKGIPIYSDPDVPPNQVILTKAKSNNSLDELFTNAFEELPETKRKGLTNKFKLGKMIKLSIKKESENKMTKQLIDNKKLSLRDKALGYFALLALVAGTVRMIMLESHNQTVVIGLGVVVVVFAVDAILRLTKR